jgi:uncharacterized protein CbrC (UPF0167 family)
MLVYECDYCCRINSIRNEICGGCGAPASLRENYEAKQDGNLINVLDSVPHDIARTLLMADPHAFDPPEIVF